jgi:hypothetical protein
MVGSNEREKIGYFNFASKVKGGFKMSRFRELFFVLFRLEKRREK